MTSDDYANTLADMAKAYERLHSDRVDLTGRITPPPADLGDWRDPIVAVEAPMHRSVWDLVRVGGAQRVGRFVRDTARFSTDPAFDPFALTDKDLVRRLTVDVLADKLPPEEISNAVSVAFKHPASAWQMFKREHERSLWLGWLVRRRPVVESTVVRIVTVTVDLRRFRTFPEADVPAPREFGHAHLQAVWTARSRITDPPAIDHGGQA